MTGPQLGPQPDEALIPQGFPLLRVVYEAALVSLRFTASRLPEGVPDFAITVPIRVDLPFDHTSTQVLSAFVQHVRDGTARGERAWAVITREPMWSYVTRDWFVPLTSSTLRPHA